jgi:hypothetical protein
MNKLLWISVMLVAAIGCEGRQPNVTIQYDEGQRVCPLYEYSAFCNDSGYSTYLAAGDNRADEAKGLAAPAQYWYASLEMTSPTDTEGRFLFVQSSPGLESYSTYEIAHPDVHVSKGGWVFGSGLATVTEHDSDGLGQESGQRELAFSFGPTASHLPVIAPADIQARLTGQVPHDPVAAAARAEEAEANQQAGDDRYPHPAIADLLGKHDLNQLRLGMSREDVEAVLGHPSSIHEWPTITVAATYTYRLKDPDVDVDLVFVEGLKEIRLWRTTGEGEDERRLVIEYYQPQVPLEGVSANEAVQLDWAPSPGHADLLAP